MRRWVLLPLLTQHSGGDVKKRIRKKIKKRMDEVCRKQRVDCHKSGGVSSRQR